jgi:Domain of unknown function (DUF5666)
MAETHFRRCIVARALWLGAVAGMTALVVACGGGGSTPPASSSAPPATRATFSGAITGFGSIIVNGVRIDDSQARIELDDDSPNARADDLRLGMLVDVQGERNAGAATGRATSVTSHSFVQGPVSDISANTLTVLGVVVTVSPATVFSGTGLTGLGTLSPGDTVEVHGLPNADGTQVKATRIERKAATSEIRLIGTVRDASASSLTINGITVQYTAASLDNLPNGVSNGMVVRVKGTLSSPTVIAAIRIRQTSLAPLTAAGLRAEVEGVVTKLTSAADFELSGVHVTVPAGASVTGTLVLGARVEVEGTLNNGTLVSTLVRVEDENEANEFHSTIATLDKANRTMTLSAGGGVTVQWGDATVFDSATLPGGGNNLTVGMRLEVVGKVSGNTVLASRIK